MMIPQNLSESAELIVNFTHEATGRTYDLKASLKDQQWLMGNTHNYLINITPDYIIEIVEEEVPIADCHYDVREITISDDQNVGWTLSSNVDWVKFRVKPADYETNESYAVYQNYWIQGHRVIEYDINIDSEGNTSGNDTPVSDVTYAAESSIESTGLTKVLVYFIENAETSDNSADTRIANLILKDKKGNIITNDYAIHQYYPRWNNNLAYERIEENKGTFPWGFASTRTITYSYPAIDDVNWGDYQGLWNFIVWGKDQWWDLLNWLQNIYDSVIGDRLTARASAYNTFKASYADNSVVGFITMSGSANSNWSVTLDYEALNNIDADGSGIENTEKILSYAGGASGSDAETWLINNGLVKDEESTNVDNTTIPQTAAYQAVLKNAWNLTTTIKRTTTEVPNIGGNEGGVAKDTTIITDLSLANGIKWFLPSNGEIADLKSTAWDGDPDNNNDEPLTGTYWTSTSGSGTTAYYYAADATTGTAVSRVSTTKHKIRAARSKN